MKSETYVDEGKIKTENEDINAINQFVDEQDTKSQTTIQQTEQAVQNELNKSREGNDEVIIQINCEYCQIVLSLEYHLCSVLLLIWQGLNKNLLNYLIEVQ